MSETLSAPKAPRFSRNELFYYGSLLLLFLGLLLQFGAGIALTVLGAVGVSVSILTSFFVTWLASRVQNNAS